MCTSLLYFEPYQGLQFNLIIFAELFWPGKEMGDVERVEDEEEGEDGGVDVEIPLRPRPLQVDERRNHRVADQSEKRECLSVRIPTEH